MIDQTKAPKPLFNGLSDAADLMRDHAPLTPTSELCAICGSPHATRGEMKLPNGQWVCSRPCELAAEAVRKAKAATAIRALKSDDTPSPGRAVSWVVHMTVIDFPSANEARLYRDRLHDVFCAMPESKDLGATITTMETAHDQ